MLKCTRSVTTTLPVVAFYLHSLQMPKDSAEHKATYQGFRDCLRFFKKLGDIHWHAGFYHDFFQMLASRGIAELPKRPSDDMQTSRSIRRRLSHGDRQTEAAGHTINDVGVPLDGATGRQPSIRSDPGPTPDALSGQYLTDPIMSQDETLAPAPPSFEFNLDDIMNFDDGIFDGWLEDYSRMQTLLPSA